MTAHILVTASETPLQTADLTPDELARSALLPGELRRTAWRTARRALRLALAGSGRPADTFARRFPSRTASLSHSAELAVAAVLVGDGGGVAGVGVDVELDRTPAERTDRFFLTGRERVWLDTVTQAHRPRTRLRLWTVKEALFKADPGNADTVLLDYHVADPAAYRGLATRANGRGPDFCYVSLALPRGMLSVALALSRPRSRRTNPVQTVEFDKVAERISTLVSVPVHRLSPDATIAELVPDSFLFVELAVDLQEEFDVVLSQHDLRDVHTLGDLTALLRDRQAGHASGGL